MGEREKRQAPPFSLRKGSGPRDMEAEYYEQYPILSKVDSPEAVKGLPPEALVDLAQELRDYIVKSVAVNPGHLGASLGVVELTIALLRSYQPDRDRIVWDVGHQAYPYKILTQRRDAFRTNRKYGGLSGFPLRAESIYDAFGTGHSSTSISAALGMATAGSLLKEDFHTVAIIGDGALTGGMAFEALNNAGAMGSDLLVILNDNNMSIDPNVGALKDYLLDIATSPGYNRLKNKIWNLLGALNTTRSNIQAGAQKIDGAIKTALLEGSNLFESFGFRYFGPIDGHDTFHLEQILTDLRKLPGPKLLHCRTVKGKGYAPAERDKTEWHAPGRFDYSTGIRTHESPDLPPRYQDVFGSTLLRLAKENPKIVGITPAMPTGSSLLPMMEAFPERTFDVGIAEQHAVTFAAGLAAQGMLPFCVIYSSFMQRAFDQVIHDVALQNLHVVFCLDRAGLVGDDGATHHGVFDIAYMRLIPNITLCAPADEYEMEAMMQQATLGSGPWVIRYPRGHARGKQANHIPIGLEQKQARCIRTGKQGAMLAIGTIGAVAEKALDLLLEKGIEIALYDMRFVKPIDTQTLQTVANDFPFIFTIEDGCLSGGFGSAVLELLAEMRYKGEVKRFGIPDQFIPHGDTQTLRDRHGLAPEFIAETIAELVQQ